MTLDGRFAILGLLPQVQVSTPPFDGTLGIVPFYVHFLLPPGIWPFPDLLVDVDIPADPALSGVTVLLQSLTGPSFKAPKDAAWTNCATLAIE